jgi:hypothetical protein
MAKIAVVLLVATSLFSGGPANADTHTVKIELGTAHISAGAGIGQ